MDYYPLCMARTFDEFVKLIEQSDLPFDVRQHVCSLLDSGVGHASDRVVDDIFDDIFDDMTIQSIIRWFEIAKPQPTSMDVAVQVGCHYEEVSEMLEATNNDGDLSCYSSDSDSSVGTLRDLADFYKDGFGNGNVVNFDRLALLDALCDQIVTAIGVGVMMGFDMEQALAEVNRSNYTKFAKDEQGKPVPYITPNGKIGKNPDTYQGPELEPYLERKKP